ncbi:hypothetical protein F2Q69_00059012 [Brassica cretica]|uniref:Uncharacterized protein n=1 Tax=Brassica cretica TaxID=69181 RepID=A0A8S9RKF6_BRACR|nr:hypothetical protein F2Q69_00059012 [Brassica cretica]
MESLMSNEHGRRCHGEELRAMNSARVHPISPSPKVFLILDEHSLSSISSQLASRTATARVPRSASSRPDSDQLARLQHQLVPARVRSRFSWWSGSYNLQTKETNHLRIAITCKTICINPKLNLGLVASLTWPCGFYLAVWPNHSDALFILAALCP